MASIVERLRAAVADRYDVQDEIGQGGMARVFRAEDRKHGRRVAVKVLRPELAAAVGAERFLREIEISAGLRHPNVLPLFDSGEADGLLYYVMPLVEGESLRTRMERERQLPLEDALEIALEVADALSYAHSRGVVHRDIKPENILLESGHAVVTDFGIARAIEGGGRGGPITEAGLAIGTPAYMSPEQASGDAVVDGRTDLYALGCVLYEMLAGEPPHTGPTPQAILARSLTTDVRPLPPVRASVTPALESVVRRALAPVAADRYHTCHEFAEAVRAARAGTLAPTAAPSLGRAGVAQLARRMLGPILGALALGAVALLAYRLLGPTTALASGRLGIAVFPFRDTGEGAGWWAEALGDLLATTLDGTPGVSVADPWSLWQSLREGGADRAVAPDADEATRLAGRAGARRFVLGSGFRTGDQLDVTLRIYELGSPTPVHTVTATGSLSALPTMVQELAVAVIAAVWQQERLPEVRDVSGYTTRSADALNAYLDARGALRAGMVDSAERAIDQAIALDTNFALALVEAVRIKSWALFVRGQSYLGLLPLVDRAARFLDSLSERNRSRVEATRALVRTDGVTAMNAARRIVEIDSTDLEGWNLLAYAHQAYGWQYAAGLPELRIAAERATALDPGHLPSLISRAWVAAVGGDSSDVALQITRLEAADTAQPLVAGFLAGLRAATVPDPMFDSLVPRWGTRPSAEWIAALRVLRVSRPARAESLVAAVRAAAPAGPAAAFAQGAQLQLWLAQGRIRRTDSLVQTGGLDAALWLRRAVEFHLVAANLAGVGDSAVASRVVDSLAEWFPPDSAVAQLERRPVWRAGWAIGAHHATFGDTTLTRRWRAALEPMPREGGLSQDWVGALQADFDARLAARRGDLAEALDHARRAYRLWTVHTDNIQEGDPEPAMRLHLGMLHAMGGEVDSAESYLRSLVPPTAWLGFLTARASFELGRLAEQRRSLTEATRYYARALDLWELGGDEVSAWRAQAREGLARVARRAG